MPQMRARVAAALPDEARLLAALAALPAAVWEDAARHIEPLLPGFETVLSTEDDVAGLATSVARARRPHAKLAVAGQEVMLRAHLRAGPWWVEQASLRGGRDVLICTSVLTDGLTELHLGSLVRSAGLRVAGVLAAVEFTTRGARGRLEMLGARVDSLVRLADTPRGVEFERRGEKVE